MTRLNAALAVAVLLAVTACTGADPAENDDVGPGRTIALLRKNGAQAAAAVRSLTDEELDRAAAVSLYENAPLTCQFFVEDHALRHSYHHLGRIRRALSRESRVASR